MKTWTTIGAKRKVLYEGKTKTVYEGSEPGTLIHYFRDDVTDAQGQKQDPVAGKGVLNNRISAHLMTKLEAIGIPTHFMRSLNMREQLVRQLEVVPLEVVIRNVAAGSLCSRFGLKEGTILTHPVVEYYYKKEELGNPLANEHHVVGLGWADPYELEEMVHMAWRINDYLNGLFSGIGLRLVDFKLEFGRLYGEYGELYILLADEISPDTCLLWDARTNERLGSGQTGQGQVIEACQQVAERLGLIPQGGIIQGGSINEQLAASLGEISNEVAEQRKLREVSKTSPNKPWKV